MAKENFLVDLDLYNNQILNVSLQNLPEHPSVNDKKSGWIYWNTTDKTVYVYIGADNTWLDLGLNITPTEVDAIDVNLSGTEVLATIKTNKEGQITEITTRDITLSDLGYVPYTHPTFTGNTLLNSPLTGSIVISNIQVNSEGHVTGFSTRSLTPANIGAAPTLHTHLLSQITDVVATADEVNLLHISGMVPGLVLKTVSSSLASWSKLKTSELINDYGFTRINDSATSVNQTWSSTKIQALLGQVNTDIELATANSVYWDLAYSWGDHSIQGYLKSFTETDPIFTAWLSGNPFSNYYNKSETDSRIQAIVGAAPAALDTLVEIATQLQNDESVTSALITTVSNKADKATTLAGYGIIDAYTKVQSDSLYKPLSYVPTWSEITSKPTFATVAITGNYSDLLGKPTLFDGTWSSLSGKPSNIVTGTGTANYLSKWSSVSGLTNSLIYDNGTNVGIGTISPSAKLDIINSVGGQSAFRALGLNGYIIIDNVASGENYYNANTKHEFQIGGSPFMNINSSGNVGIGTTTPSVKLEVNGKILADDNIIAGTGNGGGFILGNGVGGLYRQNGTDVSINTFSLEAIRIVDNGNVGIGTTNPSAKLTVNNDSGESVIKIENTGGNSVLNFQNDGLGNFYQVYDRGSDSFYFQHNGAETMRLSSIQNVLIGSTTDNGTDKLQVNGSILSNSNINSSPSPADPTIGGAGGSFGLNGNSSTNYFGIGLNALSSSRYDMFFQTGNGNGGGFRWYQGTSEKMRIDSSGNVGIGTSNPQNSFQIYAPAISVGNENTYAARFGNNSDKGVVIGYDTTNNVGHIGSINPAVAWTDLCLNLNGGNVGIGTASPANNLHIKGGNDTSLFIDNDGSQFSTFYIGNNGNKKGFLGWNNSNSTYALGTINANDLFFATNNIERVRVTSNGDLVVGATSNPFATGGRQGIFINGSSTSILGLGVGGVDKGYLYHDGNNMYLTNEATSNLIFSNNGSERMRIANSGNLLINTTTDGGDKLQVNGSSVFVGLTRNAAGGLQIGKFGVASNPQLSIGLDTNTFSTSAIVNSWGNSSNPGISIGTTRTDGIAFNVVTGVGMNSNTLPSTIGNTALRVLGNGNVLIGTSLDNGNKLYVNGDIRCGDGIQWGVSKNMIGTSDFADLSEGGLYTIDATSGNSPLGFGVFSVKVENQASTGNITQTATEGFTGRTFIRTFYYTNWNPWREVLMDDSATGYISSSYNLLMQVPLNSRTSFNLDIITYSDYGYTMSSKFYISTDGSDAWIVRISDVGNGTFAQYLSCSTDGTTLYIYGYVDSGGEGSFKISLNGF